MPESLDMGASLPLGREAVKWQPAVKQAADGKAAAKLSGMATRKAPSMNADRVRALLDVRKWRPADLARAIDVGDERMTKWLKWGQCPSGYDVALICDVLDVDAADLFGLEREMTTARKLRAVLASLAPPEKAAVLAFAEALLHGDGLGSAHAKAPRKPTGKTP